METSSLNRFIILLSDILFHTLVSSLLPLSFFTPYFMLFVLLLCNHIPVYWTRKKSTSRSPMFTLIYCYFIRIPYNQYHMQLQSFQSNENLHQLVLLLHRWKNILTRIQVEYITLFYIILRWYVLQIRCLSLPPHPYQHLLGCHGSMLPRDLGGAELSIQTITTH